MDRWTLGMKQQDGTDNVGGMLDSRQAPEVGGEGGALADWTNVYSVEGGILLHARRSCPVIRTELPYRERASAFIRESRATSLPAPSRQCSVCWEAGLGGSAVENVDTARTLNVEIDATRVAMIRDLALRRHDEMAGRDLSYGVTSPERQFTGLLGEAAVLIWLARQLAGAFEFGGD